MKHIANVEKLDNLLLAKLISSRCSCPRTRNNIDGTVSVDVMRCTVFNLKLVLDVRDMCAATAAKNSRWREFSETNHGISRLQVQSVTCRRQQHTEM